MSGIAELLLKLGYRVSGSDLSSSDITDHLRTLGGTIFIGHKGEQIKGANSVVVSSAVSKDNPEIMAARNASIPVIQRAEMLAELMRSKFSIAIAGAHGKTSTTSITSEILIGGGLDPTIVIGGKLKNIGANAVLGQGRFLVAEADESDGSFLKMSPAIAVVTNIDLEHLDYYRDLDDIKNAFSRFLHRIPFYGLAILCLDNEPIQDIIPELKKRYITYGINTQADYRAKNMNQKGLQSSFDLFYQKKLLGNINLNLPGLHNIYNAMAGIAVGMELHIPFVKIKNALESLGGVQRRLEIKGEVNQITVVDDYGHHPVEIKTTLKAAAESWPGRRKVAVFQPHRYTRTKALFKDFTEAFHQTDILMILPIYSAGENEINGVNSTSLCEEIRSTGHRHVIYAKNHDESITRLKEILKPKDIMLTIGAGDVFKIGERLLEEY